MPRTLAEMTPQEAYELGLTPEYMPQLSNDGEWADCMPYWTHIRPHCPPADRVLVRYVSEPMVYEVREAIVGNA